MSGCILHVNYFAQPCVFVKQSPGPILCGQSYDWRPLSRSYRTILPSSLTVTHSSASVFSTQLRVSVCGTGTSMIKFSGFSREPDYVHFGLHRGALHTIKFGSPCGFACKDLLLHPSTGYSVSRQDCHFSVSTSLIKVVTEY